jgi:hypothetical protein
MATFQTTVVLASTIILVISLIFIGLALRKQKNSANYPPVIANCPDYWLDSSGNNGSACVNAQKLGDTQCGTTMDFSTATWSGEKGSCAKNKWARGCNLSWDGITNVASVCGS